MGNSTANMVQCVGVAVGTQSFWQVGNRKEFWPGYFTGA